MVLKKKLLLESKFSQFKKILDEAQPTYNALSSLRTYLRKQEDDDITNKKIRHVQNRMKAQVEEGISTKKRVPGTGTKVVTTHEYKDTPENQKLGRVGKTYERVTYKDAEYTDYTQKKMRRLKLKRKRALDEDGNPIEPKKKRTNFWIDSMKEAKEQLNAPKMILPLKTITDENCEKQKLAHEVYLLARKINEEKKAEAKAAKEAEAVDAPVEAAA